MTASSSLCFLVDAVSAWILCYFHWFCLLHPWTLFLLYVERLTETVSLTWRFIPRALAAALWNRDHSTAFHLTRFRTASSLPAAGSGEMTGYSMKIPTVFTVPFRHTVPKCFWIPGWILALVFQNQLLLRYTCLSHLGQCHWWLVTEGWRAELQAK